MAKKRQTSFTGWAFRRADGEWHCNKITGLVCVHKRRPARKPWAMRNDSGKWVKVRFVEVHKTKGGE